MEYDSTLRMGAAVENLDQILAGEAEVWLIDFSCFISQNEGDEITSKIYGAPSKCHAYNTLLSETYKTDHYKKYVRDCWYICDLCDSPKPIASPELFSLDPSNNLVTDLVSSVANDREALTWFEHLARERLFGSGLVVAKDAAGIQANIFVLFSRPLGLGGNDCVAIDRDGRALGGSLKSRTTRKLAMVIREIESLLVEEMMAATHARILRDRTVTIFATHEVTHTLGDVRQCRSLEAARGHAIGLAVTLLGGLELQKAADETWSLNAEELAEVVASLRAHAAVAHAKLEVSLENGVPNVPWWLVYALIENTRNALEKILGAWAEREVLWKFEFEEGSWQVVCRSKPYSRSAPRSSGEGRKLIEQFAGRAGYVTSLEEEPIGNPERVGYRFSIMPRCENENASSARAPARKRTLV